MLLTCLRFQDGLTTRMFLLDLGLKSPADAHIIQSHIKNKRLITATWMSHMNVASSLRQRTAFLGMAALLGCMIFFGVDVVADITEHISNDISYRSEELVHLIFEILAVFALAYATITLRSYLALLKINAERSRETIQILRGNFDEVLHEKFNSWNLTPAERDITLLIIRGLNVADIAMARNTAPGTIKAQSTSIFRKIGVRSKTELMSLIIDEFLDTTEKL